MEIDLNSEEELFLAISIVLLFIFLLYRELNKPTPQPPVPVPGATGVISGSLAYNNAPVVGADVILYLADKVTEVTVVKSDNSGNYVLPAISEGSYHITAYSANPDGTWLQADQDVSLNAATLVVSLTLVSTIEKSN